MKNTMVWIAIPAELTQKQATLNIKIISKSIFFP